MFDLEAAVLWIINDFSAYRNLLGWSTKGYLACPICNEDACSCRLRSKIGYLGHRRWLRKNHPWLKQKELFNNEVKRRNSPRQLAGDDILSQLN